MTVEKLFPVPGGGTTNGFIAKLFAGFRIAPRGEEQ
jgi:hypothetical protein